MLLRTIYGCVYIQKMTVAMCANMIKGFKLWQWENTKSKQPSYGHSSIPFNVIKNCKHNQMFLQTHVELCAFNVEYINVNGDTVSYSKE